MAERRKERKKEGRKEGRKEVKKEGRKEGRKEKGWIGEKKINSGEYITKDQRMIFFSIIL